MANRISELEAHLRQWESDKRRRTAAFTLIPIAAAVGVAWYAYNRIDTVEEGVDRTLAALDMPAEPGAAGSAARLARLEQLGSELQGLRPLTAELATLGEERAAAEAALATAESELARANDAAAALTLERDRLAAELETVTAAADERLAQAAAELDALRAARDGLERRVDLVERERRALSAIAAERQAALDAANDARAAAEAQMRELGAEQARVRDALVAQLATAGSRMAAVEQQLAETRAHDEALADERAAELERQLQLSERNAAGLQTVKADLETRLADAEDALIAAETAAKEAAAKLAARDAALDELESRHEADARAAAELERQLELSERNAAGLRTVKADLETRLADAEDALIAAETAAKEAAAKLAARDAALDELESRHEADARAAAELERQLELSERNALGLRTVKADLETRLAHAEDALIAAETAAKEAAAKLAARDAALDELESRHEADARAAAELERQLQLSERNALGLRTVKADLETRLADAEDALIASEAGESETVASLRAELAAVESRREADAAALAERGKALDELERQLELSGRTVAGLQAVRDDLEARLAKTEDALIATEATESEQVAALRADLAERERDLAASQAALAELEDRRAAELAVRESQGAELAELQRQLGLAERTASGLQTVRKDLEGRLAEAEDALIAGESAESEKVAGLEAALAERTDALAASQAALAELEDRRTAELAERDTQAAELAELQRRLGLAERTASGLQTVRKDLEGRLAEAEDALMASETTGSAQVASLEAALAERETALAAADGKLQEVESRREADEAALAERGVELAELQRRLELADWSRDGLQAARDELEEKLAEAEAAGTEAVTALQAELAERGTALAATEQKLEEVEGQREADEAALAERGVELAELQRRLELADWSRDGLQAARDDLEQQLVAAEAARSEVTAALRKDLAEREKAMAEVEAALVEAQSKREAGAAALAARGVELAELQRQLELAAWTRSGLQAARDDLAGQLAAANARGAALEAELQATAASVPLAASESSRSMAEIVDLDAATRGRLATQAAELAELRARTETQATLLAEREAEVATLEAARQAEADQRLGLIGEQLGSSLRPLPVTREAAEGAVERERRLSADVLAMVDGGDDVALLSGRNVAFTAGLMFPSAEAELTQQGRAALNQVALELKQLVDALPEDLPWMLRIDGHTDDLPIRGGRFHSNWELSAARASSVAEYLVQWGLPADRLIAAGFADTQPLVEGRSEEARSRNRRIELKLTVR